MYNEVKEKLFKRFEARRNMDGTIEFLVKGGIGGIVAILFPKQEVINVFLRASPEIVWNHNGFAIFVLARKYTVMTNSRCKKVEAAWLIGMCGAAWAKNLCHPFFLESDHYVGNASIFPLGRIQSTSKRNVVTFEIFDYDVTYTTIGWFPPIDYTNPALMYPVKLGRKSSKKGKEVRAYLRNKNAWYYTAGYYTAGSAKIRRFIDEEAKRTNHTEFSKISYIRLFK